MPGFAPRPYRRVLASQARDLLASPDSFAVAALAIGIAWSLVTLASLFPSH